MSAPPGGAVLTLLPLSPDAAPAAAALRELLSKRGRPAAVAPPRPASPVAAREAFVRIAKEGGLCLDDAGSFRMALRRAAQPARDALAAAALPVFPREARRALDALLEEKEWALSDSGASPGDGLPVPAFECRACRNLSADYEDPLACAACLAPAPARLPGRLAPEFVAALDPFAGPGWPDTESPRLREAYPAALGVATGAGLPAAARALVFGLKFMGRSPFRALLVADGPDPAPLARALDALFPGA